MRIRGTLPVASALLPSICAAHHAFRAVYDFSRTVEIEGANAAVSTVFRQPRPAEPVEWIVVGNSSR